MVDDAGRLDLALTRLVGKPEQTRAEGEAQVVQVPVQVRLAVGRRVAFGEALHAVAELDTSLLARVVLVPAGDVRGVGGRGLGVEGVSFPVVETEAGAG